MWFAQKSDSLFHSFLKSSRRKSLSLLFNKEQQWDNGSLHSLKKAQLFHYSSQKTSNSLENQRVNSHPWNFVRKKVDCQPYSYLMSPVSHLLTHVSCLTYPVSCLMSPVSPVQHSGLGIRSFAHHSFAKIAQVKWVNEQIASFFEQIVHYSLSLSKNEWLAQKKFIFLYVFYRFLLKFFSKAK